MKEVDFFENIEINEFAVTPKYLQLVNGILTAIANGQIKYGTVLPSINEVSYSLEIARDTAEKGYKHLKYLKVLDSIPGKGYFVINTNVRQQLKIILIFNKLSAHKKIIYDAFVEAIGTDALIHLCVYNNDFCLFKKILSNQRDNYSHYVIIPHFIDHEEEAAMIINGLPKDKLILVDKILPGITGNFGAVYENFEKDLYNVLSKATDNLSKYQTIKLIFPNNSYYPMEIIRGFNKFCIQNGFISKIVNDISTELISKGDVYINLMEDDLITLVERLIEMNLVLGTDVGVISYNETPIKKHILNGITTISTDFYQMGKMAAMVILENSRKQMEVAFNLVLRPSL